MTNQEWINRAALYELLALGFLKVAREFVEVVDSGEYAEALAEIGTACGLNEVVVKTSVEELSCYTGIVGTDAKDAEGIGQGALFHELRIEYTRLFVGAPEPAVSPYAGVWWAKQVGVEPLLFVNKESMAVERFMRSCGVGQPEGTNEPLDHIGSELEFLQYLSLLRAEAAIPPEGVSIPKDAYEGFYREHFIGFAHKFAAATMTLSRAPFYRAIARVLAALPEAPL
ncbi:MAG: molecular chaperone TorD family protein [Coriobacteriales bacterium]|jgi:TorA maturation chaperone TorD|nr:molecular chaperone TorD family protein [Coriobacteriales bacterium]